MKKTLIPRAILSGLIIWALIFVVWSVIIFVPALEGKETLQYIIHYILLIPIVILGASLYYKGKDKVNGLTLGLTMLATGIILDALITIPLFTIPQGTGYADFYLNPLMLIGYAELLLVTYIYRAKKFD